jgi:2-C-methyl-D-erythritol 4-phosphate cytidylyltransferase
MNLAVIIPAAGGSTRYSQSGGLRPKLDEDLGTKSVLQRTVELFTKADAASTIIVAGPHDPAAFAEFKARHGDRLALLGVTLCRGGISHRYETVQAALVHVPADATHIAVHDAARPCTPPELLDRLIDAARHHAAVIPCIEVPDTLKRVRDTDEPAAPRDPLEAILGEPEGGPRLLRLVESTVDRRGVYAAQTPQIFRADLLRRAYAQADLTSTDDASLVERLGERVAVIEGDVRNLKITRPGDMVLARAILGVRPPEEKPAHKRF